MRNGEHSDLVQQLINAGLLDREKLTEAQEEKVNLLTQAEVSALINIAEKFEYTGNLQDIQGFIIL